MVRRGINCLVHFAGALEGSVVDIDELTPETWHRIININLNGTYNVTRSVAKHMKKRKSGVILLTSSGAGVNGPGSRHIVRVKVAHTALPYIYKNIYRIKELEYMIFCLAV